MVKVEVVGPGNKKCFCCFCPGGCWSSRFVSLVLLLVIGRMGRIGLGGGGVSVIVVNFFCSSERGCRSVM